MLLTYYPYIIEEGFPYYYKQVTWNLFHLFIYVHSQRLINEYPGYVVQDITTLQYQCANMTFSNRIRYNRLLQKVFHKGVDSAINYIDRFQNDKVLAI